MSVLMLLLEARLSFKAESYDAAADAAARLYAVHGLYAALQGQTA